MQSNSTTSGQHFFSRIGNVALTKGDLVWSTSDWSDEFKVEYDVIVTEDLPPNWKNLFLVTTGEEGSHILVVYVNPDKYFIICYPVNGNTASCQNYYYELNKEYHFEISQNKNSKGEAIYNIKVNGKTFHEIVNTTPLKFQNVLLYLSNPWHETLAPFGKLSNLKIIADLTVLGKFIFNCTSITGIHLLIYKSTSVERAIFQMFW